jgi:hypothetical protein
VKDRDGDDDGGIGHRGDAARQAHGHEQPHVPGWLPHRRAGHRRRRYRSNGEMRELPAILTARRPARYRRRAGVESQPHYPRCHHSLRVPRRSRGGESVSPALGTGTSTVVAGAGRPDPTHCAVLQPRRERSDRHQSQPTDITDRNVRKNVLATEIVAHAEQFSRVFWSDRELLDLNHRYFDRGLSNGRMNGGAHGRVRC